MSSFDQAEVYNNNSKVQKDNGLKLIDLLAPEKGSRVLDVGCGTGYLSKVIADRVGPEGNVMAIDPDVERLKVAREKHSTSNLKYVEGCAENLPGGGYDIIFSNYVLQWVKDISTFFEQSHRKLNEGGRMAFVYVASADRFNPPGMYSVELQEYFLGSTYHRNEDEIKQLALKYDFKIQYIQTGSQHCVHPDVHHCIEYFMGVAHGMFDKSHFNVQALQNQYGDGEIHIQDPIITGILLKN